MTAYDLVIVGSGSGNALVTPDLDGWDIAIVEEGVFGGTCLNVGCIPTKMFVYPAELADHVEEYARLGLHGEAPRADWPAIRDRIFGRIDAISRGGRDYRKSGTPNVTLYEAHAEFDGPRSLRLSTGETITGRHVVLAAGSRVAVPRVVAASGVPFHTSDTVMRLEQLPERLIILGAGYVAAEFANVFTAFGTHVTMAARSTLLRELDHDIAGRLADIVGERWHLHRGVTARSVSGSAGDIRVELEDGTVLEGDTLLVAVGRTPNGDRLNLSAAGIDTHADGRIAVDEFQRTSSPNVWALGDVSSRYQLKHVANHEERTVAHNLAHPDALVASDHRFVPSAVFTHPQVASVGVTEQQVAATGRRYVTYVQAYGSTAYGWAMEDSTGICKLIADPATGRLIGAHLLGEEASVLIQPLVQAMSFGLGVREMARGQYWIHPALTEVVENALLGLQLD